MNQSTMVPVIDVVRELGDEAHLWGPQYLGSWSCGYLSTRAIEKLLEALDGENAGEVDLLDYSLLVHSWGDGVPQGAAERANARWVADKFGDYVALSDDREGDLRVNLTRSIPVELAEVITSGSDYPLHDDEYLSRLEDETRRECWEEFGREAFRTLILSEFGKIPESSDRLYLDDVLEVFDAMDVLEVSLDKWFDLHSKHVECYWIQEGASSGAWHGLEAVAARVARMVAEVDALP
ncbi:hypothetical protein [Salininema proteolyticum]|uniref:CdiI immunity protein domain-containing protein n=1 Tax=Salininema proteolyticum TaxID=1607685 RepID=A0ABV8TU03_9ACTN